LKTICPYPDCRSSFEVVGEQHQQSDRFGRGQCPNCGRHCVARPAELITALAGKQGLDLDIDRSIIAPEPEVAKLVVVLDDIRSLHNVGAVFRTADAAGFSHIYLSGITGVPPRKEISKVSLGAEDWLPYSYHLFLPEILTPLKASGYSIVALERDQNSRSLYQALVSGSLKLPLCLLVGNEVQGVSIEALALCDDICHLNMRGKKESLNASVAFGVAAYFLAEILL
jgi:tRNA G18 (ribose-2'-O)-methylase SpoU